MIGIFRFFYHYPEVILLIIVIAIPLYMLSKFSDICIKKYKEQNKQDDKHEDSIQDNKSENNKRISYNKTIK